MASPRRRARNYAAEYARRQRRARELGFGNYYERRVRAGAPPSAPKPTGKVLRRRRGHAAGADLLREAPAGSTVTAQLGGRDAAGRYHRIDVTVLSPDGEEHAYTLQGSGQLSRGYVEQLVGELESRGSVFSPSPSLDLRQIGASASPAAPPRMVERFVLERGVGELRRWVAGVRSSSRLVFTRDVYDAVAFDELDEAEEFYARHRLGRFRGVRRIVIVGIEFELE